MKEKLTLTIEKEIKKRAKRHAKAEGISVSQMVEDFLNEVSDGIDTDWKPKPGSAVEQLMNAIPESKKVEDYDYDKLRHEALKEKYDLE